MDTYDPVDHVSPTPEQEEARLALWRRADRLARDTLPGTPPASPAPPASMRAVRRRPPRGASPRSSRARARPPTLRRAPKRRRSGLPVALLALLLLGAGVATCSVGVEPSRMISEYGEPVPVSSEVARDVFARGSGALRGLPESGELRVTLTEAEVTSVLGLGLTLPDLIRVMRSVQPGELDGTESLDELRRRLRTRLIAADAAAGPPSSWTERVVAALDHTIGLEDAQVRFSGDDQVVFAGSIRVWEWRQPTLIAVSPSVEAGALRLELRRAQVGRLTAPPWLFDRIERVLSPQWVLGATVTDVSRLEISDDSVIFEGRVR